MAYVDPVEFDSRHVTHYGREMHVGASQEGGFTTGAQKLILESSGKIRVLLKNVPPGGVHPTDGDGKQKSPVTKLDFLNERPEIVEPDSTHYEFSYKDLRQTLSSVLEKLTMLAKLRTDETMSELTLQRIEIVKTDLKRTHDKMAAKIRDNIQAMKKAAKSKLLMSIFGWIMAVALTVAAIFTGGVALMAAFVGALGLSTGIEIGTTELVMLAISAALSVTTKILDETGAMEKWQKELTEKLKEKGRSNASLRAQLAVQMPFMIVQLVTGIVGMGAIGAIFSNLSRAFMIGTPIVGTAMGLGVAAQQGLAIADQYRAAIGEADVSEVRAMIQLIQQMLDEVQEELQEIMEKLQDLISKMFEIIASALDAQKEIAQRIGQMA